MSIDYGSYHDYELLSLRLNSMISSKKMKASKDESLNNDVSVLDEDEYHYNRVQKQQGKDAILRRRKETLRRRKL